MGVATAATAIRSTAIRRATVARATGAMRVRACTARGIGTGRAAVAAAVRIAASTLRVTTASVAAATVRVRGAWLLPIAPTAMTTTTTVTPTAARRRAVRLWWLCSVARPSVAVPAGVGGLHSRVRSSGVRRTHQALPTPRPFVRVLLIATAIASAIRLLLGWATVAAAVAALTASTALVAAVVGVTTVAGVVAAVAARVIAGGVAVASLALVVAHHHAATTVAATTATRAWVCKVGDVEAPVEPHGAWPAVLRLHLVDLRLGARQHGAHMRVVLGQVQPEAHRLVGRQARQPRLGWGINSCTDGGLGKHSDSASNALAVLRMPVRQAQHHGLLRWRVTVHAIQWAHNRSQRVVNAEDEGVTPKRVPALLISAKRVLWHKRSHPILLA